MANQKYPQISRALDRQIAGYLGRERGVEVSHLSFVLDEWTGRPPAFVKVTVGVNSWRSSDQATYEPSQFPYGWRRLRPLRNAIRHSMALRGIPEFRVSE